MTSVVSLFSSSGGSSLGYKYAGCDVVGAVDCAPDGYTDALLRTYRANHDTPLFEYDISTLDGSVLLDDIGFEKGELDILDGSPPCRPFTNSNTSKENKGFGHKGGTLFDDYARLVDEIEPKYFVAENVPAIASGDTRGYFKQLCNTLRSAGSEYSIDVRKIEAHKLGSPHRRTRLFILGSRSDMQQPTSISYTYTTTVGEALRGVSNEQWELEAARRKLENSKNSHFYKLLSRGQRTSDIDGCKQFSRVRLSWNKSAQNPTSVPELIHPTEDRFITISELQRLMGLPDWYQIVGNSFNDQWKAAIQCLPPILVQTIAESLPIVSETTEAPPQRPIARSDP